MDCIVITNNPLARDNIEGAAYYGGYSLEDVLVAARDMVHMGHRLLTHPLSGSVKPGQTPYKSVALSARRSETVDADSLMMIENALAAARKLIGAASPGSWPPKTLADFQLIDYSLIEDIRFYG